ncbi:MAG: outer membrane lipoprotein carrier protein LolA [Deltaproteobacteria bacterium]|nr:outer membrane lipoprotein carrier protein LolA [Deltaproteobacteria bacterium]
MKDARALLAILLLFLLAAPSAQAQSNKDWRGDFQSLRKAGAALKSIQADFTQEKQLAILANPLLSQGRLLYQAPDALRWEYIKPMPSLLLLHGKKASRFNRKDGRWVPDAAERIQAMRLVLEEIRLWLSGRYEDSGVFTTELVTEPSPRLRLTPKSPEMAKIIQGIVLHLAEKPGQLEKVEIIEGPKSKTILTFHNIQTDKPIEKGLFSKP